MKITYFISALLLIAQFSFSEQAKITKIDSTFKFKDKNAKEIEVNQTNYKDLKFDIKIRPSEKINKVVFNDIYEVVLAFEDSEVVFETKQFSKKLHQADDLKIINYAGNAERTKQDYSISCYDNEVGKSKDSTNPATVIEETKTIECIKKEECKSYAVKDNLLFEIANTPVCIGTKEAKVIKNQVPVNRICEISTKESAGETKKSLTIIQLIGNKESTVVKSSEKCK